MGEYMWGAFVVVAIVAFSIAGSATIIKFMEGSHECNQNTDCKANNYCGSDFKCHVYPNIENNIVKNDWTTPAAVLGLAIIVAAFILRKREKTSYH